MIYALTEVCDATAMVLGSRCEAELTHFTGRRAVHAENIALYDIAYHANNAHVCTGRTVLAGVYFNERKGGEIQRKDRSQTRHPTPTWSSPCSTAHWTSPISPLFQ